MKKLLYLYIFVSILFSCSSYVRITYFSLVSIPEVKKCQEVIGEKIGVENFSAPPVLNRQEIICRKGNMNGLKFFSHKLWWGLPQEMITEFLKNYLIKKNLFSSVLSHPSSYESVNYFIAGIVKQFELHCKTEQEWESVVSLQIFLVQAQNGKIIWDSGIIKESTKCKPSFNEASAAMTKSVQKIFKKVLEQLKILLVQNGLNKHILVMPKHK